MEVAPPPPVEEVEENEKTTGVVIEKVVKKRKIDGDVAQPTKVVNEERTNVKRKKKKKKKKRRRKKFKPPGRKSRVVEKEYECEIDYLKDIIEEKRKMIENLQRNVQEREETAVNDGDNKLLELRDKWKDACEEIFRALHVEWEKKIPDKQMKDVIQHFRVLPSLVSYDDEEDEFTFFKS